MRSCGILAGFAAILTLAACGSQQRQDAQEPSGTFPVAVTTATFPSSQHLAQHTHLVIAVRNTGHKAIPNLAVTITTPPYGTSVRAFAECIGQVGVPGCQNLPGYASHSRPVWVVTRPPSQPGQCFSCTQGGFGGATSAYANTWAWGRLKPGDVAKFDWTLVAVIPGNHTIRYQIAAGLNGKAKARLSGGAIPQGTFNVKISNQPQQSYVNNSGKIVVTKSSNPAGG